MVIKKSKRYPEELGALNLFSQLDDRGLGGTVADLEDGGTQPRLVFGRAAMLSVTSDSLTRDHCSGRILLTRASNPPRLGGREERGDGYRSCVS